MSQNKKPAKAPTAYSNHFEAMKTLTKCRGIHPTCKLVLLDILAHANSKGGIAYPSQATIAKDIGYSTRQVQRAIAGLAQVRAIEIVYQTKQAARDAGILIKGDPVLDKNGAPVQENLNTMQVLFGWDGMCKKAISPADKMVLNEHMKGAHDATGKPRAAKKPHTPRDRPVTTPGDRPGTTPGDRPGTTPVTDVSQEHLTVIEHRLDRRNTNEKGSLKASLSLSPGEPASPAEKEKAKALVTRHPSSNIDSRPDVSTEVKQLTDTGNPDSTQQAIISVPEERASSDTNHPLSCLEFLKAFKNYNNKWVWTRTSVARFKQNWESHPDFRSLSSKIILALQTNTQLPIFCPNLDPNYLFYSKDSHDLMIWEKLLTGVAYFTSTKQPTPEPDWNLLFTQQTARLAAEDSRRERHNTMLKSLTDAEWEERRSSPDIEAWDKARLDGNTTTEKQDPGAGKPALAVSGPSGPDPAT